MKPPFQILALDGGAASGKSSTARALADRRHFLHIDTGTHYRAVTAAALQAGISPEDETALGELLAQLELETRLEDRSGHLVLNGAQPSDASLRTPEVNAAVSRFAALPAVREAVKRYQQAQVEVAREAGFAGLVMDGRDIGTVILPEADLKVFLFADEATRAERRAAEGQTDTIAERDRMDAKRKTAPLSAAPDAVKLDNSHLTLEQVVDEIERLLDAQAAAAEA
ncbi:MAG: (d)CMP kinase [Opitutales bacterium]